MVFAMSVATCYLQVSCVSYTAPLSPRVCPHISNLMIAVRVQSEATHIKQEAVILPLPFGNIFRVPCIVLHSIHVHQL